jgi:HAD superfamily hydrolase (TIGR01509 family)
MEFFMRIFEEIDLFLFDLDGLLVDTEMLHWKAYQKMCQAFGYTLGWDYPTYLGVAGGSADGIHKRIQREIPQLFHGRMWEELYAVKKEKFFEILASSPIPLMPGVEQCLPRLAAFQKPMAVVTHSPKRFVEMVQASHPVFGWITRWVSREMYDAPKPAPDGYLAACRELKVPPDRAIGFEDTVRGIDSLLAAGVHPVLVNENDQSARAYCEQKGLSVIASFFEITISKESCTNQDTRRA